MRYHLAIFMLSERSMVLHSAMTLIKPGAWAFRLLPPQQGQWAFREARSLSFSKAPMDELGPLLLFLFSHTPLSDLQTC